jgi:ribose transport system substrate-binding protein
MPMMSTRRKSVNTVRTRRGRLLAVAGSVALAALALAGCDATGSGSSTASATASAGATGLAADVQKLEQPLASWPIPTAKVSNPDALKGKTVYFIPITLQAPQFGTAQTALTAALTALGANVQVCDGQGTPTAISACVGQATKAGAAAIIADAIQYEIAGNAFDAAQAAGIPVVIADQAASSNHPDSKTLATITGPVANQMAEALAKWTVVDSDGKADVLANNSTDGSSPAVFFSSAKKVYDDCSGCKVTVNDVSSANFSLVTPSTSSALLKDADIDYLQVQFGQFLQASNGGVQASGRAGKVQLTTGSAQLGELQAVASGDVAAAASPSAAFEGWIFADAALRMVSGDKLPDYTVPMRLFTKSNIGSITLSADAMNAGAWYGPSGSISAGFTKLWGVS